eukprot:5955622-Prymnesium_polylepis.1
MVSPTTAELQVAVADARDTNQGVGSKALVERFRRELDWDVDNKSVKAAVQAVHEQENILGDIPRAW